MSWPSMRASQRPVSVNTLPITLGPGTAFGQEPEGLQSSVPSRVTRSSPNTSTQPSPLAMALAGERHAPDANVGSTKSFGGQFGPAILGRVVLRVVGAVELGSMIMRRTEWLRSQAGLRIAASRAPWLLSSVVANGHDLVGQPLGRLRERRRAHNLVELCVEPSGSRIGEALQRLITVLEDEPS
jgi:hypothetical protein